MTAQCKFLTKRSGARCTNPAIYEDGGCGYHSKSPENIERRADIKAERAGGYGRYTYRESISFKLSGMTTGSPSLTMTAQQFRSDREGEPWTSRVTFSNLATTDDGDPDVIELFMVAGSQQQTIYSGWSIYGT